MVKITTTTALAIMFLVSALTGLYAKQAAQYAQEVVHASTRIVTSSTHIKVSLIIQKDDRSVEVSQELQFPSASINFGSIEIPRKSALHRFVPRASL